MEIQDYFLKVIKKHKEVLNTKGANALFPDNFPIVASDLSDVVKAFVEWKDKYVYYVPKFTDTEFNKSYLYIWWDGLEIKNRHQEYFTLDELFIYFIENVYKK